MTLVDYNTGEIVDYDRAAAERRAERITMRLDAIAENYSRVLPMIREAIEKRDDIALGYASPGAYVSDRFGQSLANLGMDVRREVVRELTEAGMSTRAIAPVVGVGKSTVERDSQVSHMGHLVQTSGSDTHTAASGHAPENRPEEGTSSQETPLNREERHDEASSSATPPPVTGLDGKTYTRPAPRPLAAVNEAEWDEQDRAEELARNLARNLSLLYALTDPARRAEYVATWSAGTVHLRPLGADFITPQHMRDLSAALNTFADEWENAHA